MNLTHHDLERPANAAEAVVPSRAQHSEPPWDDLDAATWHEIARDLVVVDEQRLYRADDWRCRDTAHYAERNYCLSRVVTEELLRAGRKLRELPLIERLLEDGLLSWRHVVLLTRVAVPRYERAWVRLAFLVPLEQLELLVERSGHGWAPPSVDRPNARVAAVDAIVAALGGSPGDPSPGASPGRMRSLRRRSRGASRRRAIALRSMDTGARERRVGAPARGASSARRAPNVRRSSGALPPSG